MLQSHYTRGLQYPKQRDRRWTGPGLPTGFYADRQSNNDILSNLVRLSMCKKCTCTRACAPMQRCRFVFAIDTIVNLSWVLRKHRAGCRLSPALLLSRRNHSPDAVRSKNPSKSTLAHEAFAAAVSHKCHSIICVGADLIHLVYCSHSKRGHGARFLRNSIFAIFSRAVRVSKTLFWNHFIKVRLAIFDFCMLSRRLESRRILFPHPISVAVAHMRNALCGAGTATAER